MKNTLKLWKDPIEDTFWKDPFADMLDIFYGMPSFIERRQKNEHYG